jgi:hypothetical protein
MVGKTVMKLIVSWIEHKNGDKVIEIPKYFQAHLEWANFITWNSKPSLHSEGRGIDSYIATTDRDTKDDNWIPIDLDRATRMYLTATVSLAHQSDSDCISFSDIPEG